MLMTDDDGNDDDADNDDDEEDDIKIMEMIGDNNNDIGDDAEARYVQHTGWCPDIAAYKWQQENRSGQNGLVL